MDEKKVCFVTETKDVSPDASENLHRNKLLKIECGKTHFAEFEDVDYRQVSRLSELL